MTVNTSYKIHEVEYLLRQADIHTLIMVDGFKDSDYISIINTICPELKDVQKDGHLHSKRLPFLRNVITTDSRQPGCIFWEDAMAMCEEVSIENVYRREAALDKHDVCNMQYTSGTTGFPRGSCFPITTWSITEKPSGTAWTSPPPTE